MSYELLCGDALFWLDSLADNSIDAVVTDPPYGLDFMGKHWDTGEGFGVVLIEREAEYQADIRRRMSKF
jgi:site-specific DNA-methyltransferase (adenine-specific)